MEIEKKIQMPNCTSNIEIQIILQAIIIGVFKILEAIFYHLFNIS
jgi:hypothetical protein